MNRNVVKTFVLMAALGGFFVLIGAYVGQHFFHSASTGMVVFLLISVGFNMASYWWSDKLVIKMTRSKPVDRSAAVIRSTIPESRPQRITGAVHGSRSRTTTCC